MALFAMWPRESRLVALLSGQSGPQGESRWSIFAPVVRTYTDALPAGLIPAQALVRGETEDEPPFIGGYIGYIGYDFAQGLHPQEKMRAAGRAKRSDAERSGWPMCQMHHCPAALCYDKVTSTWHVTGEVGAANLLGAAAVELWHIMQSPPARPAAERALANLAALGPVSSTWSADGYQSAVRRALELIARGDIYQVNLTHTLKGAFSGSARALMTQLHAHSHAWFGTYLESPETDGVRRVLCGQSPELFLRIVPVGKAAAAVSTRPMKGTRARVSTASGGDADGNAATELLASEKEQAELTMIIDLMRNDLGRVCVAGSVTATAQRTVEAHGGAGGGLEGGVGEGAVAAGVWQAVATVAGQVEHERSYAAAVGPLLEATLPGGSITGAPKLRAMQVIDELEPHERGPYCGVMGYFSACGRIELAMAIRTALLTGPRPNPTAPDAPDAAGTPALWMRSHHDRFSGGTLTFPVGAGIVAESDPQAEWEETLLKAGVLQALSQTAGPVPT